MRRASRSSAIFAFILTLFVATAAPAQDRPSFIRDAEIEDTIRVVSTPLFQQAGLPPEAIDVYLINDDTLNAFVAGGLNMFLHTGFLLATDNMGEVAGVIAHETGHLEGGHIAARKSQIEALQGPLWATYVLGLGAAILSGDGRVGAAAVAAGQNAILRDLLLYTRGQEASADQAAVRLMEGAGYSAEGLLSFMSKLRGQEALLSSNQDPYLRSHPLTTDRMNYLRDSVTNSPFAGKDFPSDMQLRHARMQAKLIGFLKAPNVVMIEYPESDQSLPARYARSIMHYRSGRIEEALTMIDGLLAEFPEDPYFHELKGQILFENGRVAEAVEPYRQSVRYDPESALLRMAFAHTLIEANDPSLLNEAKENLTLALSEEPRNASAWRQLAIAEGRMGNVGKAALALAEAAAARGDFLEARGQSERALSLLPEGSGDRLRAEDLKRYADSELKNRASGN